MGAAQDTGIYLHALDGRIRVKSSNLKGASHKAAALEQQLRTHNGITEVTVNPITGSILVFYDTEQIAQQQIFDLLRAVNCLPEGPMLPTLLLPPPKTVAEFGQGLLRTVAMSTMEFAVQRLVFAIL
jgi:copper chaperone CopZ